MARLDVYPMPGKRGEGYVVDVQADLLSHLATRVVVPLLPQKVVPMAIGDLNPVFEVSGNSFVMVTQAIATVAGRELKGVAASLNAHHDRITRALDILLLGF